MSFPPGRIGKAGRASRLCPPSASLSNESACDEKVGSAAWQWLPTCFTVMLAKHAISLIYVGFQAEAYRRTNKSTMSRSQLRVFALNWFLT